jgi:hypothetical protein
MYSHFMWKTSVIEINVSNVPCDNGDGILEEDLTSLPAPSWSHLLTVLLQIIQNPTTFTAKKIAIFSAASNYESYQVNLYRVPQELRSLLRDLIPELILSQKCHITLRSTSVLRKVTSSVVARVRKAIQADGGHFKQLAWMLNGEFVTVHFTKHLNKCTMLHFFSNLFTIL